MSTAFGLITSGDAQKRSRLGAGSGVDEWNGGMKPWQRLVAVIWDAQFLCVQRAVYRVAHRFAGYLDELARRRDEELRMCVRNPHVGSGRR